MPRVKRGTTTHKRHASLLERAKGFRTGRHSLVKRASEALLRAGMNAYRDRRTKKRMFRRSWIIQINAAARLHGLNYSRLMNQLQKANIIVNRRVLADMAINEPGALESLIKQAGVNAKTK